MKATRKFTRLVLTAQTKQDLDVLEKITADLMKAKYISEVIDKDDEESGKKK